MSADSFFSEGNEAFADDDYIEAIKKYTSAIEQNAQNPKYYNQRANAFIKLGKYQDALADTSSSIELDATNAKAFLRKGIAHFHLKEFMNAKEAFENALKLEDSEETKSWILKCDAELPERAETNKTTVNSKTINEPTKEKPKPGYDWYQTDSRVVINILVKNRTSDDVKCVIEDTFVSVCVRLEDKSDFSLSLTLPNAVIPAQSKYRVSTAKIEIQLKKAETIRWSSLEKTSEIHLNQFPLTTEDTKQISASSHSYPTSSHVHRNWDKLAADIEKEEQEEKLEGDAALNQLFQKIYGDGSDEVKRAMNKSFVESGGTVLSTNWSEVGNKKVECKPPDGMQFKKY
ncbi:protein SGT1 homolog [Dendronephthya gigantea]|uniref:protein SGT1 homolog n=1 Tax=Dendronephthya gigantea TaxID=151771 RepID=UPI0010695D8D|nr:protein SGT1 homolog [Dendronephthya gigantea]